MLSILSCVVDTRIVAVIGGLSVATCNDQIAAISTIVAAGQTEDEDSPTTFNYTQNIIAFVGLTTEIYLRP